MITELAYFVYKYKTIQYYLIGIASFVITIFLLPKLQELVATKVAEPLMQQAATYLVAFILATIVLPHIGYWFVKSQGNSAQ